jgi:hypothetical protein
VNELRKPRHTAQETDMKDNVLYPDSDAEAAQSAGASWRSSTLTRFSAADMEALE